MSQFQKAKERLKMRPKDYKYSEAAYLLKKIGFIESNKGKTSGSRVCFYREKDKKVIMLHKPHPDGNMKSGAVKDLVDFLEDLGEL